MHETEKLLSGCRVHNLIDPWQREAAIWTFTVEIYEINAHLSLVASFLD